LASTRSRAVQQANEKLALQHTKEPEYLLDSFSIFTENIHKWNQSLRKSSRSGEIVLRTVQFVGLWEATETVKPTILDHSRVFTPDDGALEKIAKLNHHPANWSL
jgi:hypothetical protein